MKPNRDRLEERPMTQPEFPIPVVAFGPGSQPDDAPPALLSMPRDMATYQPPALPEPAVIAGHAGARAVLQAAHAALQRLLAGEAVAPLELDALDAGDRAILNQVLGEGEVAARVDGPAGLQAQESVFAGVWRVLYSESGVVVRDTIELGAIPAGVVAAAQADGAQGRGGDVGPPGDTMNAPSVLEELRDHQRGWQPGRPQHVVNLTLLPLTAGDSALLDARLGAGRVTILSRGYANCRVVDTWQQRTWRVTYFNSQDIIILDTLEIGTVPEVACAAREDLQDSAERLGEVLQWLDQARR
jgi:hydrogenase-1 operon protein HyaF